MLDVSDIHLIQTIADLGSISKAADQLNISQPTLSKKLSRLEQVLKISLFYRHNVGMLPTDAAKLIIERGKKLSYELNTIERHIELMTNLEEGTLNVGIGPIIEQLYFPKMLLDFTEETRNIKVSLRTDSSSNLLNMLLNGELDIALGPFSKDNLDEDLVVSPIQECKLVTVVRPGHPLLEKPEPVSWDTLLLYPMVAPHASHDVIADLEALDIDVSPDIVCDNYETNKSVVMSSDYFTGGPELIFRKEFASGSLAEVKTDIDVMWRSLCVIRPESAQVPVVNKFLEILNRYTTPD